MTRQSWFRQFLLNQKFDNRFEIIRPGRPHSRLIRTGINIGQTVVGQSTLVIRALVSIFSFCVSDLIRILNWNWTVKRGNSFYFAEIQFYYRKCRIFRMTKYLLSLKNFIFLNFILFSFELMIQNFWCHFISGYFITWIKD